MCVCGCSHLGHQVWSIQRAVVQLLWWMLRVTASLLMLPWSWMWAHTWTLAHWAPGHRRTEPSWTPLLGDRPINKGHTHSPFVNTHSAISSPRRGIQGHSYVQTRAFYTIYVGMIDRILPLSFSGDRPRMTLYTQTGHYKGSFILVNISILWTRLCPYSRCLGEEEAFTFWVPVMNRINCKINYTLHYEASTWWNGQ